MPVRASAGRGCVNCPHRDDRRATDPGAEATFGDPGPGVDGSPARPLIRWRRTRDPTAPVGDAIQTRYDPQTNARRASTTYDLTRDRDDGNACDRRAGQRRMVAARGPRRLTALTASSRPITLFGHGSRVPNRRSGHQPCPDRRCPSGAEERGSRFSFQNIFPDELVPLNVRSRVQRIPALAHTLPLPATVQAEPCAAAGSACHGEDSPTLRGEWNRHEFLGPSFILGDGRKDLTRSAPAPA